MKNLNYIRIAALSHEALGTSRVKVIFKEGDRHGDGQELAYWVEHRVYDCFYPGIDVTLQTMQAVSKASGCEMIQTEDLDIYSSK